MKYCTDNSFINKLMDLCREEYRERAFNIENFNIQQLYALYESLERYLREYLQKGEQRENITYKSKNGKSKYYTYIIQSHYNVNKFSKINKNNIEDVLKLFVIFFIEVDIKNFKNVKLKAFILDTKKESINKIIDENVDEYFNKVSSDIESIIENIENAKYTQAGCVKFVGMKEQELIGYYNTKYIEIDAGGRCKLPNYKGKRIKVKYRFDNMIVYNTYDGSNSEIRTEKIFSKIMDNILQLVLRTAFVSPNGKCYINNELAEIEENNFIFDNTNVGKMKELEYDFMEVKVEKDYEDIQVMIPINIDKIIDNYFKINNKQQEIFYNSCKSYNKALTCQGSERLFHLFKAIENIVVYEEKYTNDLEGKRIQNIKSFIGRYIRWIEYSDIIAWWYEIRNKYAHNGIDYEGIFDLFFTEHLSIFRKPKESKYYSAEDYFEAIVHFVLLKWLLNQTNEKF